MNLDAWLDRELTHAASAMQRSISATGIVKERPGFGQTIRAAKGSVVASPVLGAYDPEPDYFFHWFRDSAVVMDALRMLFEMRIVGFEALATLGEFIRFSLSLEQRRITPAKATPDFQKYLRDDAALARVTASNVAGETRVNPDGTLDISKWARPQHDGPALRALTLMRWQRAATLDAGIDAELAQLLRSDLAYTREHWREPSFDLWEEESGRHYYTLRVAAAALEASGDRTGASEILRELDALPEDLDIAMILGVIHSGGDGPSHTVNDPRMHAVLDQLDAAFIKAYPINQQRPAGRGPALGRYVGDVYFDGGAWYVATLAAAEFCFRAAKGAKNARSWIERGNAYLETVRAFTPASGDLSEQFDQVTGAQKSAKHLAWSYAAFVSCMAARRRVDGA
ncbi:MAG TPA: glycoside hydrolase family 15 protein [Nevskiaceae bacterium]|nr:glycoside hydrolase family 15 protein [Nevskiaceae bacterium]